MLWPLCFLRNLVIHFAQLTLIELGHLALYLQSLSSCPKDKYLYSDIFDSEHNYFPRSHCGTVSPHRFRDSWTVNCTTAFKGNKNLTNISSTLEQLVAGTTFHSSCKVTAGRPTAPADLNLQGLTCMWPQKATVFTLGKGTLWYDHPSHSLHEK
jgi:hypothetical protein